MATTEPTPLEGLEGFTDAILEALQPYWITTAEDFSATARMDNEQFGDGLTALSHDTKIDLPTLERLHDGVGDAVPGALEYSLFSELDVGDGLILDGAPAPGVALSYTGPPEGLPPEVLITAEHMPGVLDQGRRNTCVAFTMVAMYQLITGDTSDLSEQFLFWACKSLDGLPNDPRGTLPDAAVKALVRYGVCPEQTWGYLGVPKPGNVGQGPPPAGAVEAATRRKITRGGPLRTTGSADICLALAEGRPVLLGLDYYSNWQGSGQARRGGRVRRPLTGEPFVGGHAVCAVGYRQDPAAPGGGYIIVRNSWGTDWGTSNSDGPGYGHVPYSVVDEFNRFAYVIEAPRAQQIGGGDQAGGAGAPQPPGPLAEARAALARAQAELDHLRAQLDRLERGER